MSALDLGARGLASRAHRAVARTGENAVSLAMRGEPTAAALEALAAEHGLLVGEAGTTCTVERTPFIQRTRLTIRGNGAELRNVSQTPLNVEHNHSAGLNLGVSTVWETPYLSYYPVLSASGPELALEAGAGANFATGDLVVLHGATSYPGPNSWYDVFRNYLRARVVAVAGDSVVLDRGLPPQLLADAPVIANADEGMVSYLPNAPRYYLLYAPHVSNLKIASDVGTGWQYGGVIDGVFRDIEIEGRNGIALNAMQDCLFENIRFRAWRKICELAEGSHGTVIRGLQGTLSDASARFGGASDVAPFFIGINENCAECVYEDFAVSSGPNNAGAGSAACQIGSGRDNQIRNSRVYFPSHTGRALTIQAGTSAANGNRDSGYRNVTVTAPVCSHFLVIGAASASVPISGAYAIDCTFRGNPATRAAVLAGAGGRLLRCWFEAGDLMLAGTPATIGWRVEGNTADSLTIGSATGCVIRGNYLRGGFTDLTPARLAANTIEDNESDASRLLDAAAVISDVKEADITTTSANEVHKSMVCPAGSLAVGDKILVRSKLRAAGLGGGNRTVALSVSTPIAGRQGCGARVVTAPGSLFIEAELTVVSNTSLSYVIRIGNAEFGPLQVHVDSLAANALTIAVEAWISGSENIGPYGTRIVVHKRGMRGIPVQ